MQFPKGASDFPFLKLSRLTLKPTQPPVVWVQGFSPGADVGGA